MAIKDLRFKMLEEAYQMIVDDGIENFTVRNLSKKLNISHNTMYRHFKSKSELIYTLLEVGFEHLAESIGTVIQKKDLNNFDKFRECVFISFEFAVNNPHIYKLMFATEFKNINLPEGFTKAYGRYYYQVLKSVEDCINSGEIKKGTKYSVLNTTWGLLHGLAILLIDDILPLKTDMNALPRLPNISNSRSEPTQFSGCSNIRDIVGFSIDALLDSFISTKEKSG
jgi:AcrR family transcriptional regulator